MKNCTYYLLSFWNILFNFCKDLLGCPDPQVGNPCFRFMRRGLCVDGWYASPDRCWEPPRSCKFGALCCRPLKASVPRDVPPLPPGAAWSLPGPSPVPPRRLPPPAARAACRRRRARDDATSRSAPAHKLASSRSFHSWSHSEHSSHLLSVREAIHPEILSPGWLQKHHNNLT